MTREDTATPDSDSEQSGLDEVLPFLVHDVTIRSESGEHAGLVVTPRSPIVFDRSRIEELRNATGVSPEERGLLRRIRERDGRVQVVLFRAENEAGEKVWQFDPGLGEDDTIDAGYVLARASMPLYRRMLAAGVVQMVHTDSGIGESFGLRRGLQRLTKELEAGMPDDDAVARLDLWIVKNMLLHAALSLPHVVERLLPDHLRLIERRREQIQPLIAALPASALA